MVPVNVTYSQWRPGRSVCPDPPPPPPAPPLAAARIFPGLSFLRRQLQSGYWYAASRQRREWRVFFQSGKKLSSAVEITWNLPSPSWLFCSGFAFSYILDETVSQNVLFFFRFKKQNNLFPSAIKTQVSQQSSKQKKTRTSYGRPKGLKVKLIILTCSYIIHLIYFVYQAWQLNEKHSLIISCTLTLSSSWLQLRRKMFLEFFWNQSVSFVWSHRVSCSTASPHRQTQFHVQKPLQSRPPSLLEKRFFQYYHTVNDLLPYKHFCFVID